MESSSMSLRAWSTLDVKSIDAEKRILTGIASTPTPDRQGDVMLPDGAKFSLPMPLLWQHRDPIGEVFDAKVTAKGIEVQARIAQIDEPGLLKDRLDLAWQSIRAKLVKGLSIGWRPLKETYDKVTGNFIYPEWEWYELSAVTIPANADATIQTIKSLDVGLALSGTEAVVARGKSSAGVPAIKRVVSMRTEHSMKKSYADQIATWEATRAAKSARQDEIQQKALDEGRAKDEAEREEFKGIEAELKAIDEELVDLRAMDAREKAAAKPVEGRTADDGSKSRSRIVVAEKKLDQGIGLARMAMCVAMARGNQSDAIAFAKQYYPVDSLIEKAILGMRAKAAVGAGAVVTSHWADDLVPYNVLSADFIEYLRAGNIVDKFGAVNPGGGGNYPTLRRVPFNVRVSGFSAGLTGNWVGEGKPAPMSKATSFNTTLTWAKVEALAALTKEEIRFSNPGAEAKVRDDIAKAVNTRIDIDFVDPAKAATANVSPASITNAIVATAPTAATAAGLITDLTTMIKAFGANNLDPSDIVLIMSSQMALAISMMTTTLGMPYFPDITMKGGTLRGFPVLVSENLTSVGSPGTQTIVAVKASEVFLADDGNVTVDASDQASLEMLDGSLSQDGTAGTGASLVSLWQNGLVGILAQREITWKLRRSTAVQYISPAAYSA
jgi:HK97 family phage major capsid protein/HK97 family phage prohead protease